MIIYDMPRRSGKTTMLMQKLASDPNAYLLVADHHVAQMLKKAAPSYHVGADRIRVFGPNAMRGLPRQAYALVDELDWCLSMCLGANVKAATTTALEWV